MTEKQDKRNKLEEILEKEIEELQIKYDEQCKPLDQKRHELVNGLRDPTSEELAKLPEYEKPIEKKDMPKLDLKELQASKGIPNFWLMAMGNSRAIKDFIQEHDKPILKHLIDIKPEILDENVSVTKGIFQNYRIVMVFSPNEYFKNTELVKTMIMDKDDEDMCKEARGTEIQWNEGKDVTTKTSKKKKKNKSKALLTHKQKQKQLKKQ